MIDYSKWPRKKLSVVNLKLDDLNPRLPGLSPGQTPTQPKIIDYLLEHEGVYDLAKGIAAQGYLLNEEPVVCKEGKRWVVLEGNRRVAACKLIINPDLVKSKTKRKILVELLRGFDLNIVTKMDVRIAPDRDTADVLIINRHTEGSTIEKWDKTKQDRFFHNRVSAGESIDVLSLKFNIKKSAIKETLVRYNMYNELLDADLEPTIKKEVTDETKFAMTNVERFYNSKLGKEFLGISFSETGTPIHSLPKEEYKKRLKRIVIDVVNKKLNSRTYGDESFQTKYLETLKTGDEFDFSVVHDKRFESEYKVLPVLKIEEDTDEATSETKTRIVNRETPENKLIATDCNFRSSITRLDNIFKELKTVNLDTHFNSAAVLFRSYIDMLSYQFLHQFDLIKEIRSEEQQKLDSEFEKKERRLIDYILSLKVSETDFSKNSIAKVLGGKSGVKQGWVPSLKRMLVFIAKSETLIPDGKLRQALSSYVKGNSSYLDHNDFNLLVHNEYFFAKAKDLKDAWDQLLPIIAYINQQLSKKP